LPTEELQSRSQFYDKYLNFTVITEYDDTRKSGNIIDNVFGKNGLDKSDSQDPGPAEIPKGKTEVVTTYLELAQRPAREPNRPRLENLAIMRAHKPTVSFYRYLYNTVGKPYSWYARRTMGDAQLLETILHKQMEIYVLYVGGVPAGFVEFDKRVDQEVEIVHLGLMEEFNGRGLGRYLLDWAIDHSWQADVQRIWTHITNNDHPKAMGIFQQAGFRAYHQSRTLIDDPRYNRLKRRSDE
jgi:ribosomal protein S18 acetylase RimI-like enzyme